MSDGPLVSIILAVSANGVIGREGGLPWSLPTDLQRFMQLTLGSTVIMGRLTAESIRNPLRERTNIVLTSGPKLGRGFETAHSLDEALRMCESGKEVFVIGGRRVYEEAMPRADRLYVTRVMAQVEGDVRYMPSVDGSWRIVRSEGPITSSKDDHPYLFEIYERVR
ncbi:MAG: dihydrofolate reductase [Planctomycetota bacterium]|nr:dihydrofolate reductase [Planctomycetota bacterium]